VINLRYNLQWIVKQQGNFTIEETLIFPLEMFERYAHINGLKDILVKGTGNLDSKQKRLYVDIQITGIMLLPCALTLEEVEYPFTVSSAEVFSFEKPDPEEDIREVKKGIVELAPVVFENIMIEVPMRVVKETADVALEGKGWKMLDSVATDKDDDYIDPRLAKLKDYFKDK